MRKTFSILAVVTAVAVPVALSAHDQGEGGSGRMMQDGGMGGMMGMMSQMMDACAQMMAGMTGHMNDHRSDG